MNNDSASHPDAQARIEMLIHLHEPWGECSDPNDAGCAATTELYCLPAGDVPESL